METLPITSRSYTLSDFLPALQDPIKVELDRSALESIRKSNKILNDHLKKGTKIYGVTTGFGKLSQFNISAEDRHQLQLNLVRSHAAGVGEPFETGIVRTAMLIKLLT
ncbi:MAG: aromatic amino acid lyase, partial [Candidatus Marinimicrobia bacterium]|nr:aromatic amino acid lyase [Candidatus Neomarinimicrobiota bacterium]